jgi:hypothetical protein
MRNRAFRSAAAILSILFLTGIPAQAGPIVIRDVVQVLSNGQNPDIRLRGVSQNSTAVASGVKSSLQSSVIQSGNDSVVDNLMGGPVVTTDSLLSGLAIDSDPQSKIEIIDAGDVEGTVCDCGEITVTGGGIPKWPLLFLAAVPLFFIHDCDDCEKPPSSPTPTPTPTATPTPTPTPQVPEPASLFLFGTGLAAFAAGMRRRYAKAKLTAQITPLEEE